MSTSERLVQLVEKQTKKKFENLTASTTLEEMGIDSFDFIEMLFLIEDEFGVEIDSSESGLGDRLKTVGDVVTMIDSLPKATQPNPGPVPLPSAT